jgi:hypothetical protein
MAEKVSDRPWGDIDESDYGSSVRSLSQLTKPVPKFKIKKTGSTLPVFCYL